jgi:hypothetical protein
VPNEYLIRHPEITEYPPHVFERGYPVAVGEEQLAEKEARGWVRVADDEEDFNALRMEQLRELVESARAAGRDVQPAGRSKADLVAALEADRSANRDEAPEVFQGP